MHWYERCASTLLVPNQTLDGALQGAVALASMLGFEYCGYTLETILPVSAPRSLFLANLDGELLAKVEAHRAQAALPTALHARNSAKLMLWPIEGRPPDLFWMDMRRLGVRAGWTLAAADRNHAIGRFTALRTSGPFGQQEYENELPRWTVLTDVMDEAVRKLVSPTLLVNDTVTLTREEREVLAWTADGYTSKQTSRRMGISLRRVDYVRGHAVVKLGCSNITDCVVKALTLGLLTRPVAPL
jgi:DNA-binding CsgD family transcriptional regulator